MTEDKIEYTFWFWAHKLSGVLTMISHLAGYKLEQDEIDFIKQELRGTNDEDGQSVTFKMMAISEISISYLLMTVRKVTI